MSANIVTRSIVLSRREYGEADRILTVLTPDHGKVSLIAKGVRRPQSKLAGGIELFSVSDLTLLQGKSDLKTLISSRLVTYYGEIVKDVHRTMLGYDMLKRLDRTLEDGAEPDYFELLVRSLEGLNDYNLPIELCELWFSLQLLKLGGHALNTTTDSAGKPLSAELTYGFDMESMVFVPQPAGLYRANHIRLLRLVHGATTPNALAKVNGAMDCTDVLLPLVRNCAKQHVGS